MTTTTKLLTTMSMVKGAVKEMDGTDSFSTPIPKNTQGNASVVMVPESFNGWEKPAANAARMELFFHVDL